MPDAIIPGVFDVFTGDVDADPPDKTAADFETPPTVRWTQLSADAGITDDGLTFGRETQKKPVVPLGEKDAIDQISQKQFLMLSFSILDNTLATRALVTGETAVTAPAGTPGTGIYPTVEVNELHDGARKALLFRWKNSPYPTDGPLYYYQPRAELNSLQDGPFNEDEHMLTLEWKRLKSETITGKKAYGYWIAATGAKGA